MTTKRTPTEKNTAKQAIKAMAAPKKAAPRRKTIVPAPAPVEAVRCSPFFTVALDYAERVQSGDIVACEYIKLATLRFLNDLKRDDIYLDHDKIDRVCNFLQKLPHVKGKWAKERARIALEAWQVFIVVNGYGWYWKATGLRRFRLIYIEVARKNAKSTFAAGLALYGLTADDEEGPEVYSAATTRDQAKIVFGVAHEMAQREAGFRARFNVNVLQHSITCENNFGKFEALSAESSTMDGLNIHTAVVDELHAHKTRGVWDVLETATGSRENPMLVAITTSGSDRAGVCYEIRGYVIKLLKGTEHDDAVFGVVYTLDDEDKWQDENNWIKANPNLGVSVFVEDMRRLATKAKVSLSAQAAFLTKRLDVWVNAASAWMNMQAWQACGDATLREEDFAGDECIMALDLASKVDIAAKIELFRRGDHYYVFFKGYLPASTVENADNSQYKGWVEAGYLVATPGVVTDYDMIEEDVLEDASRVRVNEVAYDPYQATQLVTRLDKNGMTMVEVRPTVLNFSEPMKELEKLVLEGKFHHDGNPVLEWMFSNVVAIRDQKDNIYPRKEREENKIDGVVATIMGLKRWLDIDKEEGGDSVYEDWQEDEEESKKEQPASQEVVASETATATAAKPQINRNYASVYEAWNEEDGNEPD